MNDDLGDIVVFFRRRLSRLEEVTFDSIREGIESGPFTTLTEEQKTDVRIILESSFSITQGTGHSVSSDYTPWLQERKSSIDFYYWNRLRDYLLGEDILPPNVISRLDSLSDEILDYCGNPDVDSSWSRRGMIMGHVQSGKTTNYTALICKAADAGYRIVILLAGLTNSLRAQTQQRLDETFIGRKSIFRPDIVDDGLSIVNYATQRRVPFYGTTRDRDFNRSIAQNYGVTLASTMEPTIFITKKHKGTLENLRDWIRDQNQGERVPEPLLLIDDEADNASINTSRDPARSTAINTVIREILQLFDRSSYVGYTATPFANIFIEPNSDDEMLGDELFPRNFIKVLDPPTNYVGAHRLFDEDGDLRDHTVRVIDDFSASLPLVQPAARKHEFPIGGIPPSLKEAIRVYLLTVAIRYLRGDGKKHCSMMINVSRFNDVQFNVEGEVYAYLQRIKDSVAVNARSQSKQTDPRVVELQADFQREFSDTEFRVDELLSVLHQAISPVRVVTVNMRGGKLDYEQNRRNGLHVIAIGGLALSRGLTLEGLTVSYIIRNSIASDTLMQMARWFGYRGGYEDICRLYLPEPSFDHYEEIHIAIEELAGEIRLMEELGQTPEDFGLKVRQSPTGIRITAANKMRSASEFKLAQDFSGHHVEGHALFNDDSLNTRHSELVRTFMLELGEPAITGGGVSWSNVSGRLVTSLIRNFSFPPIVTDMTRISSGRSLLDDYMADRVSRELASWDVYVPGPMSSVRTDEGMFLGSRTLNLRLRGQGKVDRGAFRIYGSRNRVADRADAPFGLSVEQKTAAKKLAIERNIKGDGKFCRVRERPLLILHLLTLGEDREDGVELVDPVVTLSVCLPATTLAPVERTYQVNRVYREAQLNAARDEADDDEDSLADG